MKNINLSIVFGLLLILFGLNGCSDLFDNEPVSSSKDVIKKNSDLYDLISKIVEPGDNPTETIVCIDFIYPFKILIYDENFNIISDQVVTSDDNFSAFLGNLPLNQSISISYPISTTLADGTVFSVNNNSELKIAIDSCSKEDIVAYCSGLFGGCDCPEEICIWKVPYSLDNENKYASGFFESNGDGTLNFTYNGNYYTGTWVFLFVDDKLHININLEGNSQVAQDWNIDREAFFTYDGLIILNEGKNIILKKSCQSKTEYQIGDTGPAGGLVFYDKGSYSDGWRYIETAMSDLSFFEWGCSGTLINNCNSSSVGKGLFNSAQIANFHDGLFNYYTNPSICNSLNNGTVIARKALLYEQNDYIDWFLPSENELFLIYQNLHTSSLGNFTSSRYWSSTQVDAMNAKTVDFNLGTFENTSKIPTLNNVKARAIRYF